MNSAVATSHAWGVHSQSFTNLSEQSFGNTITALVTVHLRFGIVTESQAIRKYVAPVFRSALRSHTTARPKIFYMWCPWNEYLPGRWILVLRTRTVFLVSRIERIHDLAQRKFIGRKSRGIKKDLWRDSNSARLDPLQDPCHSSIGSLFHLRFAFSQKVDDNSTALFIDSE